MAHPQIAVFARLAKENSQPTRVLAGQNTLLSRTMHDIRYDAVHDEIFVNNPFAQAILVFRGSAQGEEPPIRIIQGPNTRLEGQVDRLDVDPVHNEIYVPNHEKILVFPRDGNGDVAPIRIISGPDTQLNDVESLAVDPIHNVIVTAGARPPTAPGQTRNQGDQVYGGALLIFNRTDSGNVKPIGVIQGPKTRIVRINQIQMQTTKGWIVATQPGKYEEQEPEGVFVGVWSINDRGDAPPRWFIGGAKSQIKKPRGVALNPKEKELIVADMR
ncbi:MAG: hypothetical protein DMG17_32160, partial [Acidobacteria bacterium]